MTIDIDKLANQPKKASSEAGSVESQSLSDQIAADKYVRGRAATSSTMFATTKIENGSSF